jgi:hypothetical protein
MIIIGKVIFPQEVASQVGKRFLELAPVPDFLAMKGPYIKGTTEGIQAIELFETSDAHLPAGIDYVSNRYVSYFGIAGLTYQTDIHLEAQEALKMIGLA